MENQSPKPELSDEEKKRKKAERRKKAIEGEMIREEMMRKNREAFKHPIYQR